MTTQVTELHPKTSTVDKAGAPLTPSQAKAVKEQQQQPLLPDDPVPPKKASPLLESPPIPDEVDKTLVYILSQKRKHGSPGGKRFAGWLFTAIKDRMAGKVPPQMFGGNFVAQIAKKDGKPSGVLFSCHMDTVHREEDGHQHLLYDKDFGHIMLGNIPGAQDALGKPMISGSCLGADDGAGIWIMLNMIQANVPGTYVFHVGEECGGIGSTAMLQRHSQFLDEFDVAVAFDRPRTNEVISHQRSTRCASEEFCSALVAALNESPYLDYKTSDRGVFTDTYNYRRNIPECVNIGVGYENQHGTQEMQDYGHLCALKDRVLAIDWDSLPVARDPKVIEPARWESGFGGYHGRGWMHSDWEEWDGHSAPAKPANPFPQAGTTKPAAPPPKAVEPELDVLEELRGVSLQDIQSWVESDIDWAAETIHNLALRLVSAKAVLDFMGVEL